jgi:phospholipase C
MPPGLHSLKHIVVLMIENRSFDHMLGSLKAVNPVIDGIVAVDSEANGSRPRVGPRLDSGDDHKVLSRQLPDPSEAGRERRRLY